MDKNIISIVISTKNGERFLPRSIASIERQTEKNIELIIVSDESTDNTVSLVQELAKTRPFIKIISLEKNVGQGLARNVGAKASSGNYIAILDDDDEWIDENKISNQKKFLDEHPEYVLVGAAETEFVSEDEKLLFVYKPKTEDSAIRSRILLSNQFTTSSTMFRKNAFESAGNFSAMRLAEDYDLWLRLAQEGKVANIQGCKTRYYRRLAGSQQSNRLEMNKIVLKLVKHYKNNFPHPWAAIVLAYVRVVLEKIRLQIKS